MSKETTTALCQHASSVKYHLTIIKMYVSTQLITNEFVSNEYQDP